jgi:hypothetical protein
MNTFEPGPVYFQPGGCVPRTYDPGTTTMTCPVCGSPSRRIGSAKYSMCCDGSLSKTGAHQYDFPFLTTNGGPRVMMGSFMDPSSAPPAIRDDVNG